MIAKPAHLERKYGDQFQDEAVVAAYHHRPPYPKAVFPLLTDLIRAVPGIVLDVGCGTGDIARRLAPLVQRLDALDISSPMIARGRTLPGGDYPNLRWIEGAAEDAAAGPPYDLIVAGESLHWMDWPVVFPRLREMLAPRAVLAILGRMTLSTPWDESLQLVIGRYSTNRDFQPYDLIDELTKRDLFTVHGACTVLPETVTQSLETYVESFHSRNGFSRDRMAVEDADAFDVGAAEAVRPWAVNGQLTFLHTARIVWGTPEMSSSAGIVG